MEMEMETETETEIRSATCTVDRATSKKPNCTLNGAYLFIQSFETDNNGRIYGSVKEQ